MHGPGQATVLRRNGPGDWEIEYTGPYDCDTDVNGICAFTAMYDEVTGAETGLAGVFWAWFCAGSGVAIRANDGTWGIDWVGPPILSDPTGHQQGFWAQSLAQYNGDLYCLFGDRIEWYNVGLYKRTGVGTWELVQQFNNYYPAYTNHSTLAIAASNNTLKKCHEV